MKLIISYLVFLYLIFTLDTLLLINIYLVTSYHFIYSLYSYLGLLNLYY